MRKFNIPIFIIIAIHQLLFTEHLKFVYGDSNKDRSFINIANPIPCIRRFNATHQIGCAKLDIHTYEGIVYAVRGQEDLSLIKELDFNGNQVVVITLPDFYPEVTDYYLKHREASSITGIVLIATESSMNQTDLKGFSEDVKRPNEQFGLYRDVNEQLSSVDWNLEPTNGFMFENFEIPVYVITEQTEAEKIFNKCYDKFNKQVLDYLMNKYLINIK